MAERSSSASSGKYTKLLKAGNVSGKDSKSKKRRSKQKQKKEKAAAAADKSLESDVQVHESSVLSTLDHSESNIDHEELEQNSGENEGKLGQEMEPGATAELAQNSDVLEASTPKLDVVEGASDSKDLKEPVLPPTTDQSEPESLGAAAKLSKQEADGANDDGEGKVIAADESLGQQTSSKKRMDLLSFGRSKKSKTQRAKSAPAKASGDKKNRDIKADSGSRKTKSKSLGKEPEQEPGDTRDAVKEVENSPEDAKSVENNDGQDYVSEREQDAINATGSNKAKKFKPLAGFRRHKKKENSSKSASADENIEENEEVQQELVPACDEVFAEENVDKVSNGEEDQQTEPINEDAKKKSAGKKFGPLRSFRRSRPTKTTEAEKLEKDSAGDITEQLEHSQERGDGEENCQDSDVLQQEHDVKPSALPDGLTEECTETDKESSELVPEEDEIQDKCDAAADDADTETMSPTKKGKKKSLLRRQMKKIWSTSGKTKEASNRTESNAAEENVAAAAAADEGSSEDQEDVHVDVGEVKSQTPPNSPAEASSEESQEVGEKLATDREEGELADSTTSAEGKSDEINPEAAPIKSTEKTSSLFGRQIKKIKAPIKKRKEGNTAKKEDDANLIEESTGASSADNKEITKQVKRKKSGFQKISNALKKKKSRDDACEKEDDEKELDQGSTEKEPQETDCQQVSAEVNRSEPEEENALQGDQEETEKVNDNEEIKECQRESSEEEELSELYVERSESCQDTSATTKDHKAYGNLMKPVMQELVAKMAKIKAAEPVVEPEEDSETSECIPSTPEAEREDNPADDKPRPDERKSETWDADVTPMSTSIEESEEGGNEAREPSREEQVAKSEDLDKSSGGVTSDLSSSQTAPSKGRKEEWILVNHLEISQELSHHLKVLALDSFEHSAGCCSLM